MRSTKLLGSSGRAEVRNRRCGGGPDRHGSLRRRRERKAAPAHAVEGRELVILDRENTEFVAVA
jgi:hypothetical protein